MKFLNVFAIVKSDSTTDMLGVWKSLTRFGFDLVFNLSYAKVESMSLLCNKILPPSAHLVAWMPAEMKTNILWRHLSYGSCSVKGLQGIEHPLLHCTCLFTMLIKVGRLDTYDTRVEAKDALPTMLVFVCCFVPRLICASYLNRTPTSCIYHYRPANLLIKSIWTWLKKDAILASYDCQEKQLSKQMKEERLCICFEVTKKSLLWTSIA